MEGCGTCGQQLAAVELTYDIHLAKSEGHQVINVDQETLESLGDVIQIRLIISKELEVVYDEDDE